MRSLTGSGREGHSSWWSPCRDDVGGRRRMRSSQPAHASMWARIDVKKWVVWALTCVVWTGSLRLPDASWIHWRSARTGGHRHGPHCGSSSPSSATLDLATRLRSICGYQASLPTRAVAGRNQSVGLSEGRGPTPGPQVTSGASAAITVSALGITFRLRKIYAGLNSRTLREKRPAVAAPA